MSGNCPFFNQKESTMKRASEMPKLSKELVLEAKNLSNPAARFLVANYYTAQEARKRTDMQLRHLGERASELEKLLEWTGNANSIMETRVQSLLLKFAEVNPIGQWMLSHIGVGPVLAAGFLAHLDVTQTETAGGFWAFAGLTGGAQKWEAGEKRPWSADVKQLCFHFGECIKRTSNHPDSFYGKFYKARKELLVKRNEAGAYAERAKIYTTKSANVKKTLKEGKLPDGNLDRQACNITAKIFLSHLHSVMYWTHYNKAPPKPFAIAVLGHAHEVMVPHAEMFPGFVEAYYGRRQAAE
jgi:hypothetical protein